MIYTHSFYTNPLEADFACHADISVESELRRTFCNGVFFQTCEEVPFVG